MSLKYHLIERVDPRDLTLPRKYYAHIKNGDDVKFPDLVNLISQFSTVNFGDIHGVIHTLLHVMPHQLNYGRPVHLGDFGTFYLTIKSKGKSSEHEFLRSDIEQVRIRFRPGASLRKMLRNIVLEKAAPPGYR